jgi:hypothetical protein
MGNSGHSYCECFIVLNKPCNLVETKEDNCILTIYEENQSFPRLLSDQQIQELFDESSTAKHCKYQTM